VASGALSWVRRGLATAVLSTAVGGLALVPAAAAHRIAAHAASTNCRLSRHDWTSFGYSYFESLSVSRTSCTTGRAVAKAHGRVRGWRCSRKITAQASFQYDATETCTSGGRTVQWKYTQNK
jgi:hypothetical protein